MFQPGTKHAHTLVRAFVVTLWRQMHLSSRSTIHRYHIKQLRVLEKHAKKSFPYYFSSHELPFERWPKLEKQILIDHFDQLNLARLRTEEIRAALVEGKQRLADYYIGHSTGTSGNRGYYLISERERFVWLGTILAKALPDALWTSHRVALVMPNLAALYQTASQSGQITLRFFDLALGVESWAQDLVQFRPDTIVAPPKVLRWLADQNCLPDAQLFSAAEVLDPLDRAAIESKSCRPLREIYMATEGLFAVSCKHGTLHLAEDVVHFEWETVAEDSRLMSPVVTDFTRRAQAMIRYRMNDLMELEDSGCRCGSVYQPVRRIVGRRDDCLEFVDASGCLRLITPDVLRNAIVDAHPLISDFRVVQIAPNAMIVYLPDPTEAKVVTAVTTMLATRLSVLGVAPSISCSFGIQTPFDHKLRRVFRHQTLNP